MPQPFDFDKTLKALQDGQALTGKDGILTLLIKQLTEAALVAELDSHLAHDTAKMALPEKCSQHPRVPLNSPRLAIVTALLSLN